MPVYHCFNFQLFCASKLRDSNLIQQLIRIGLWDVLCFCCYTLIRTRVAGQKVYCFHDVLFRRTSRQKAQTFCHRYSAKQSRDMRKMCIKISRKKIRQIHKRLWTIVELLKSVCRSCRPNIIFSPLTIQWRLLVKRATFEASSNVRLNIPLIISKQNKESCKIYYNASTVSCLAVV